MVLLTTPKRNRRIVLTSDLDTCFLELARRNGQEVFQHPRNAGLDRLAENCDEWNRTIRNCDARIMTTR